MPSESGKKLHHFMAVMASQLCSETLEVPSHLGNLHGTFILIMTVLTLFSAAVATMEIFLSPVLFGNPLQCHRISGYCHRLNLALSDLVVGSLAVIIFVVITAVMSANNALFFVRCLRCLLWPLCLFIAFIVNKHIRCFYHSCSPHHGFFFLNCSFQFIVEPHRFSFEIPRDL